MYKGGVREVQEGVRVRDGGHHRTRIIKNYNFIGPLILVFDLRNTPKGWLMGPLF